MNIWFHLVLARGKT